MRIKNPDVSQMMKVSATEMRKKFHLLWAALLLTVLYCVITIHLEPYILVSKDILSGSAGFVYKMTEHDRGIAKKILKQFATQMDSFNLTYFLYAESLLGAYRHQGIVPWNDVIEVIVPFGQRLIVNSVLSRFGPSFLLDISTDAHWKFYSSQSQPVHSKRWKWPFLDIGFYFENETHIWEVDKVRPSATYNKSIVFPLERGFFMNLSLPIPKDPYTVLSSNTDVNICKTNNYDHKRGRSIPDVFQRSVPCYILRKWFYFVNHD